MDTVLNLSAMLCVDEGQPIDDASSTGPGPSMDFSPIHCLYVCKVSALSNAPCKTSYNSSEDS